MRRISRGDLADRHQALAGLHVKARHRPQQRAQIRVRRVTKYIFERSALHHLATIHNDNLFGDIGDDAEIVGDQQDRHAEFVLQFEHEL